MDIEVHIMLKNKPFWFSIALIAVYLLTAYLAVPQWLQPQLEQYVNLQLGRQLQFEKLQFDPLTWSVELTEVSLVAGEQGFTGERVLFPDIAMTAESAHLRFNFWRLRAAVSTLILKTPVLTIDGHSKLMRSGHYPFISQWRQWRFISSQHAEHRAVPLQKWRLDAGRMLLAYPGDQKPDKVLLDELSAKADQANDAGQREFIIAFTAANGSAISMQGELDGSALVSKGRYSWAATLPQNVYSGVRPSGVQAGIQTDFNAAGEFSSSTQDDVLLIELSQSHLSSDQAERCVLHGLLCARIYPLDFSFSATLQAATYGVRLLSAQAQLAAFQVDANLGQGVVTLYQRLGFQSARIQVNALSESAVRANQELLAGDTLEWDLSLQTAGELSLNVQGQYHPESEHAEMRFSFSGEPEFRGDLQWQWIAAQQAEAAYPQLALQLENPAASLAQGIMAEHLSGQLAAAAMHLQLTAKLKDQELSLSENIRLLQVNASTKEFSPNVPPKYPPHVSQNILANAPTLDASWLQALLRNPQADVELAIPEQQILQREQLKLQSLIQAPILAYLTRVSAQPFDALALQMGREGQNLAEVQFEAGSAELNASSSESLSVLADALQQRPGLGIALAGVYDPLIDMKALQAEQLRTHIALATAAGLAFQSGSKPTDFSDPQVHSVIDEFARRRLPAEVLSAFAGHFGEADVDRGVIPEGDIAAYYALLFELLVDYAEIPQGALITLARYRAQAVTEFLAERGVSRDRIQTAAEPLNSAAELAGVPLPLQLRIFSSEEPELPGDSSSGL